MIRVAQRDYVVVAGVSARHQQREIVRFRAGVHEVTDLEIARHFRGQLLRVLSDVRMQINRGRMLQRLVLLSHNIDNVRVTMSHVDSHDSAERVEISAAVLVPQVLHFSFHEHHRLFVVEKNSRIQELFAQMQDFISRRAAVFLRFVIKWRKLGKFHVDIAADGNEASIGDCSPAKLPFPILFGWCASLRVRNG